MQLKCCRLFFHQCHTQEFCLPGERIGSRQAMLNLMALRFCLLLVAYTALATEEKGAAFLKEKEAEEGVVKLPSGLLYKVLRKGDGQHHPTKDSPCECHYKGTLIDGSEFDSSYRRSAPTTFKPNQVIKGWTEALQLMVEGDHWEIYVPSELAYGKRGAGAKIPPDAALVFTLELLKIKGSKVEAKSELWESPLWSQGCGPENGGFNPCYGHQIIGNMNEKLWKSPVDGMGYPIFRQTQRANSSVSTEGPWTVTGRPKSAQRQWLMRVSSHEILHISVPKCKATPRISSEYPLNMHWFPLHKSIQIEFLVSTIKKCGQANAINLPWLGIVCTTPQNCIKLWLFGTGWSRWSLGRLRFRRSSWRHGETGHGLIMLDINWWFMPK